PEAIPKVAKHLHDNPSGVSPLMRTRDEPNFERVPFSHGTDWFNNLAKGCTEFVEAHGDCGDVFLLHPLMLHAASNNSLRNLRIITNPPIGLNPPFCSDRPGGDYTLVERATLRALGKENLKGWKATGPREAVVPDR